MGAAFGKGTFGCLFFWDNRGMTSEITITRPDDWHLHVRDGAALNTVVPHTAAQFGRAIIMPNLKPPVTTAAQAVAYADRIRAAVWVAEPGRRPTKAIETIRRAVTHGRIEASEPEAPAARRTSIGGLTPGLSPRRRTIVTRGALP